MALELNPNQHHREVVDKFVNPNADYEMSEFDYRVRPSAHLAGPITITLPPVAKARGRMYSILCLAASAVNTVTIQDQDDSECWAADIVMNGKCDRILAYSDGRAWFVAASSAWPGASTTFPPGTATATTLAPTTLAPTTAG